MFKLVILAIHDRKARMPDRVARGNFEYDTQKAAEERGAQWLRYCPNDIVMIVGAE